MSEPTGESNPFRIGDEVRRRGGFPPGTREVIGIDGDAVGFRDRHGDRGWMLASALEFVPPPPPEGWETTTERPEDDEVETFCWSDLNDWDGPLPADTWSWLPDHIVRGWYAIRKPEPVPGPALETESVRWSDALERGRFMLRADGRAGVTGARWGERPHRVLSLILGNGDEVEIPADGMVEVLAEPAPERRQPVDQAEADAAGKAG